MYSQNDEEKYILEYFGDFKGTFLDIGAFDGKNLSNTYALAEKGWKGVCIEPSPEVYELLQENHSNHQVICENFAIGLRDGRQKFNNNLEAVGTLVDSEMDRWGNTQTFEKIEVDVYSWKTFYSKNPIIYDFINIDAEGMDFEILSQIKPLEVGCKMLCIEFNGKEKSKFVGYMESYRLIAENAENLIFAL